MAAGIATLTQIGRPGFYEELDAVSDRLLNGLKAVAAKAGVPIAADRVGSMLGVFFADGPVHNLKEAKEADLDRFSAYYRAMLERGIYLAPSQFEALFVSASHDKLAIESTIEAAEEVFSLLASSA